MNAVLEQVSRFFRDKELQHAVTSDGDAMLLPCSGENLQWTTVISVSDQGNCLSFISRLPVKVPKESRHAVLEQIAKINFGRRLGAFHLDMSDGEVLFCISQVVDSQSMGEEAMEVLVGVTYVSMDSSGPEILRMALAMPTEAETKPGGLKSNRRRIEMN